MPKAIIVCAVLAQYRVGSLESQKLQHGNRAMAQYRVGSLENTAWQSQSNQQAQYRVGS